MSCDELPLLEAPLRVVGYVRCPLADDEVGRARRSLVSTIEVLPACAEALLGIEDYSQLFVLFWMDRAPPDPPLLTHPDELQKMWILRKLLHPMEELAAMEFLLERLKATKNNSDFFDSMKR